MAAGVPGLGVVAGLPTVPKRRDSAGCSFVVIG